MVRLPRTACLLSSCRDVQLAALLLWHAKQGPQSDWYPYIQALPPKFDTLIHWTSAQLDELQLGTTITESGFRSEVHFSAPLTHPAPRLPDSVRCVVWYNLTPEIQPNVPHQLL